MPKLKPQPTLHDLQKHLASVCVERGWDKNSHTETFLLFVEEVGELAKEIRNITGLHAKPKDAAKAQRALEEEFADVLNYLLDLSNRFNVDLEAAYRLKHRVNARRRWK